MSMPKLPDNDSSLTREDVINQIISSIAMEELGLSHVINAEGEKLQYALGTLDGVTGPTVPASIEDLLTLNQSIRETLDSTTQNQIFLKAKLQNALSSPVMQGPAGPEGPVGEDGKSAYELAVEEGFTGTLDEWLESLKGGPIGPAGPAGENGTDGITPNIEVGSTTTVDYPDPAEVIKNPASTDVNVIFDFVIPRGEQGPAGADGAPGAPGENGIAPTVTAGTTTTVEYPDPAEVTVDGASTATNVILDFKIPRGQQGIPGTNGAPGTDGAPGAPGAPGENGIAPTVTAGTTTTVEFPDPAEVTVDGASTATNVILDFQIPRGQQGIPGTNGTNGITPNITAGTTTTVESPNNAQVTKSAASTETDVIFDFVIPRGEQGTPGRSIRLLGTFGTFDELAAITGSPGDTYFVNGTLYTWDADDDGWLSLGNLTGPQGNTGEQGPEGATGSNGLSAYEIAVEHGFIGTEEEWLDSLSDRPKSYHVDLTGTTASTYIDIPLKNVIYRFSKSNATTVQAYIRAASDPVYVNYKRISFFDGGYQSTWNNNLTLTTTPHNVDDGLYVATRELQTLWLRQRDPVTQAYSVCVVYYLSGGTNAERTDIWVKWIDEGFTYAPPQ